MFLGVFPWHESKHIKYRPWSFWLMKTCIAWPFDSTKSIAVPLFLNKSSSLSTEILPTTKNYECMFIDRLRRMITKGNVTISLLQLESKLDSFPSWKFIIAFHPIGYYKTEWCSKCLHKIYRPLSEFLNWFEYKYSKTQAIIG